VRGLVQLGVGHDHRREMSCFEQYKELVTYVVVGGGLSIVPGRRTHLLVVTNSTTFQLLTTTQGDVGQSQRQVLNQQRWAGRLQHLDLVCSCL
jgi:hypothetical protein